MVKKIDGAGLSINGRGRVKMYWRIGGVWEVSGWGFLSRGFYLRGFSGGVSCLGGRGASVWGAFWLIL